MAPDASTPPIEWGPEIRVDGKRPEWLADDTRLRWYSDAMGDMFWWDSTVGRGSEPLASELSWDSAITRIRLPADHPHYRQPTAPERDPMRERLEAFVWRVAARYNAGSGEYDAIGRDAMVWMRDAHDMTADLPKPVDPDWQTAKAIVADEWPNAAPENEHALHRAAWLGIRSARGEQA